MRPAAALLLLCGTHALTATGPQPVVWSLAGSDSSAGAGVEAALARAIANRTRVVFVVEALLIYLDAAAAERLLDACRGAPCAAVSFCFADRLAIDGVDEAAAARLFADRGFDLVRYLPKPGLARHMGVARRRS